jgi:hypothetical protein
MSTATEHSKTFDQKERVIREDFRILDTEQDCKHGDGKEWATLRVTTVHYPHRKLYVSSVSRIMVNDRGGYRAAFDLRDRTPDPAPRVTTQAARYSAKVLENLHAHYVSEYIAAPGKMAPALAWARQAVSA